MLEDHVEWNERMFTATLKCTSCGAELFVSSCNDNLDDARIFAEEEVVDEAEANGWQVNDHDDCFCTSCVQDYEDHFNL